ncbi:MAG: acyl-CoA thioesterase [Gammaproteobacteria bacterium]
MSASDARALLADFPIVAEETIRFCDMDAYGHVNNAVYLRFFESARMEYFEKIGFTVDLEQPGIGPILAETNVRFLLPLRQPDSVITGARITKLDNRWFEMEYLVVSVQHAKVAAKGSGRVVVFDYATQTKAALPDAPRAAISQLEAHT